MKEDEAGDIAYADAETADHAGGIIRKVIEQDKVFVKCEKLQ